MGDRRPETFPVEPAHSQDKQAQDRQAQDRQVFAGLITVADLQQDESFERMVDMLRAHEPASGSIALAILRASFPHVPLARRVAAVEAARRGTEPTKDGR